MQWFFVFAVSVPEELDTALDALRLGDVVKCYVSLDDLNSTAQKCCLAFEKLFDSQLPMPKNIEQITSMRQQKKVLYNATPCGASQRYFNILATPHGSTARLLLCPQEDTNGRTMIIS